MRPNFYHHLHPPTIPARQSRFRYTLGAGGISIYLSLVLLATGILEMFYYIPTPESAGATVQVITFLVPLGWLIRNLHYWSAQLLVITSVIHLLRVVFTGAYLPPRRLNYIIGLTLLVLILFLDFSGYILRWDEGIRWALVAGTNLVKSIPFVGDSLYVLLMGGTRPNSAALIRFFTWHIFGLVLLTVILGVWHIFRIRRDGGIAVPPSGSRKDNQRITRFELAQREGFAALLVTIILILLSMFIPAPLSPAMQEVSSAVADSRAPWFFLWVQQLLRYGEPFIMGVLIPMGVVLYFVLIPYVFPKPSPAELGEWFPRGGRLVQVLTVLVVSGIVSLTLLALF